MISTKDLDKDLGNYYRARVKVEVSKVKSLTYIVRARDLQEADAKIKMFVRKKTKEQGIEDYILTIVSITDMKVKDFIA